jgi:dTDP-4-dehydrorhamnose reductase
MKILLIGASGQLGSDLLRNNSAQEIVAPDRNQVDLAHPGTAAKAVGETRPDLVVNCAAFHHLTRCEEDPAQAFLVNATAVRELAAACADYDARLVTFSTDYVFGGDAREPYREDATPTPLQIYGISRLAGERAALGYAPRHAIVIRTCGLYGRAGSKSRGGNFVDARAAEARAGKRIEMACEQVVGAPTSTDDLSRAVLALIESGGLRPGIYHLVNEGVCTWFEFTQEIARLSGGGAEVVPVDRGGRFAGVTRPLYSALANTNARALGVTLRPWRDALADYLSAKHPEMPRS